jgi:methyl-accepting chemotaxis protein
MLGRLLPSGNATRAAEAIAQAQGSLSGLADDTEGEVLGLGRRLEEFVQAAGRVSLQAGQIVGAIAASNDMATAASVFAQGSRRLSACNSDVASGLSRLVSIGERLERLRRLERPLAHLVRTVRMTRVATQIETARLSGGRDSLGMLADEVAKFSKNMDQHVSGFLGQVGGMSEEVARLVASLAQARLEYEMRMEEAEAATAFALSQTEAILRDASDLSRMTAKRTKNVAHDVGYIVASLQFHDITRQQLDHVQKALEEAADLVGRRGLRRPRAADAAALRRVMRLQKAQLAQVRAAMGASSQRVAASLTDIAETCRAQAGDLTPLVDRHAKGTGLACLERQLDALREVLDQGGRLSGAMDAAITKAASLLDGMECGLLAIQGINEDLKLLAMNALVKVSRQGEAGLALAAVAEAVNRLSLAPTEVIGQAGSELRALIEEAHGLGSVHRTALLDNQEQAGAIATAAAESLSGLRGLTRQVNEMVVNMAVDADLLARKMGRAAEAIGFDRLVNERIAAAVRALEGCVAGGVAGPGEGGLDDEGVLKVDALARNYTMESERRTHQAALRGDSAQGREGPGIQVNPAVAGAAVGADDDLGDNVELF